MPPRYRDSAIFAIFCARSVAFGDLARKLFRQRRLRRLCAVWTTRADLVFLRPVIKRSRGLWSASDIPQHFGDPLGLICPAKRFCGPLNSHTTRWALLGLAKCSRDPVSAPTSCQGLLRPAKRSSSLLISQKTLASILNIFQKFYEIFYFALLLLSQKTPKAKFIVFCFENQAKITTKDSTFW